MDTVYLVIGVLTVAWLLFVGVVLLMYPKRRAQARARYATDEALLAQQRRDMIALDEETHPDKGDPDHKA